MAQMNGKAFNFPENVRNGEIQDGSAGIKDEIAPGKNGCAYSADPDEELQRGPSHRPLTVFRVIRGLVCLFVLLSTAFMMLVVLAPVCCVLVRIFSPHYSRELVAFFFGHWLSMWPFLFENINETKVVFSGDKVPAGERVMVLCNHRTEVDWMYIWNLALRKARIGYVKYVVKSSVRNVPIFGWALYAMEFLLIERKWEIDEPVFTSYLSTLKDRRDPLWLILFPEGTDFTERKKLEGQDIAERKGLAKLNYVLMPRTRGFLACLSHLRGSLDAVYDLTIAYKNRCPLFVDNLFGIDPAEVHIHIRRIPISEIPTSSEESCAWLYHSYQRKDQLLGSFQKKGHFPNSDIEDKLRTDKFLISFTGIMIFTMVFSFLTLFSSTWIRLYFGLSCAYLATATYFDWRPSRLVKTSPKTL